MLAETESPTANCQPVSIAAHPGSAAATELIARARAELSHLADLSQREKLLAAAGLTSLRSARTRRAYAGDLRAWLAWLSERGVDVLAAGRVHADLWVAGQLERGAEAARVRRRLSALSSFYRYCAAHDLMGRIPTAGVARPVVEPDYTATVGLLNRRHAQLRAGRSARPVHLIRRALDHTAGQVVQLDLVPPLPELELHRQRGRTPGARRRPGIPQHPAEVGIRVVRLHLPQRPPEPVPDELQVAGVIADRAVGQPRRGTRHHKPGQHVARRQRVGVTECQLPGRGERYTA